MLTVVLLAGFAASPTYAQSIVVNGDFSAGNTGFTSQYIYVTPGSNHLWPEGLYTVDTNPHNSHDNFYNMGDHTTGSGMMMIINGDANTSKIVWQGTTNTDLVVGNTYDFSAWVAQVCGAAHSDLQGRWGHDRHPLPTRQRLGSSLRHVHRN